MRIWALSDLHLALGCDKPMDIFGEHWKDHHLTIAERWDRMIGDDDIVLSPGDFSWASKPHEVAADFAWLAERPGHKVLIKGNHDYWWPKSQAKLTAMLPAKTYAFKKRGCRVQGLSLFGARGGDFAPLTRYGDQRSQDDIDKALEKELRELQMSVDDLTKLETDSSTDGPWSGLRLALFHYPPMPNGAKHSRFTSLIGEAQASQCIYGHLHGSDNAVSDALIDDVRYRCMSCDLIDFTPVLLFERADDGTISACT